MAVILQYVATRGDVEQDANMEVGTKSANGASKCHIFRQNVLLALPNLGDVQRAKSCCMAFEGATSITRNLAYAMLCGHASW